MGIFKINLFIAIKLVKYVYFILKRVHYGQERKRGGIGVFLFKTREGCRGRVSRSRYCDG